MKKQRINFTNFYCLLLTAAMMITLFISISNTINQTNRIDELEKQIKELKKEVISHDYQSEMIQLQH